MSKYYFLKIKEVVQETADTVSIHFWHPLNELIQYKPGQFLTVLVPHEEGKKVRRSYSMSSSPFTDVSPAITVKHIEGGIASTYLTQQVKEGDVIEVMEPMGNFTLMPNAERTKNYIFIGAGSGITPLISMIKSVLIVEPESTITLLYGNREETSIIFNDILQQLVEKYADRLTVHHYLSQPQASDYINKGRITAEILKEVVGLTTNQDIKETQFYMCGPDALMNTIRDTLATLGAQFVFHESFTTALPTSSTNALVTEDGPKAHTITMHYEGDTYTLTVPPHQSVLEAAMEQEIDLPYSCQAGMCTACLGRVIQGKVDLDEYDALTEAEIKEGFILTCVAHPKSDDVVIEVD